jgi:hypothetical protein
MATNNCITFVRTPVLPLPHNICQNELAHVLELRRQRDALDEVISAAETAIRSALEVGASVQEGLFRAFLKTTERRSVPWKTVVEREIGADYAARVLAATKPDTSISLVISA